MKKRVLYKFDKKVFTAYSSYEYKWTLEWCRNKKYKIIEIYGIGNAYYILVETPVYFSIFPQKSIPIFICDVNKERCTGDCVKLQRHIENEV